MSDCLNEAELRGLIERTIAAELLANAFAHLAGCAACRERLASLERQLKNISAKTVIGVNEHSSAIDATIANTVAPLSTGSTIAGDKTIIGDVHDQRPASKTIEDFAQCLTTSGLMSADELNLILRELPAGQRPRDARALADLLVQLQKLTSYQANVLAEGKTRGLVLGNYVVLEKLGEGGMGLVFKARHRRMKRTVAIKILPPNLTRSPDALQRFHREVEVAAKLTHPNIAAAYDADEADGIHFLVMEFVDGPSLSAYVRQAGAVPVAAAVNLTLQAARGLSHAHTHGVIHRDIKPSNLLVNQEGMLKVLDMGLARLTDAEQNRDLAELTQSGRVMGTVDYMAPEQAVDAKNVDHRADIYSLGCTLYYLLTGKSLAPEGTLTQKLLWHQSEDVPPLSAERPDVPDSLNAVFQQMLAKDPEQRQATMDDVCRQLDAVLTQLPQADLQLSMAGIDLHLCAPPTDRGSQRAAWNTRVETPTKTFANSDVSIARPVAAPPAATTKKRSARGWLWGVLAGVALLAVAAWGANAFREAVAPKKNGELPPVANTNVAATPNSPDANPTPPNNDSAPPRVAVNSPQVPMDTTPTPPVTPQPPPPRPFESLFSWLFQNGGRATLVLDDGQQIEAANLGDVPAKSFELTAINLDNSGVRDDELGQLAAAAKTLQSLSLANVKTGDAGLTHIGELRQLRRLVLAKTALTNDGLAKLARLEQLRELNLQGTAITDQGLSPLVSLPSLEKLFLADTQVGDVGAKKLTEIVSLREVGLNGSYLTDDGYSTLAAHPLMRVHWDGKDLERSVATRLLNRQARLSLATRNGKTAANISDKLQLPRERFWITAVDLSNNLQVGDEDLKLLAELAKVQSLNLAGTSVSPAGLPQLHGLVSLKSIDVGSLPLPKTALDALQTALPDCEIKQKPPGDLVAAELVLSKQGAVTVQTPDGETIPRIKARSLLPASPFALRGVHWEGCGTLTNEDLRQLCDLPSLEQLELAKTNLTDAGLATLSGLPLLRFLSLSETAITNESLAQLARFPALQRLYLAGVKVDSAGLRTIAKLDGLTHLSLANTEITESDLASLKRLTKMQRLVLTNTRLTDASLEMLRSFAGLKELVIDGTQITDAGVEELSAALSGCNVIGNPPDPGRVLARWVLQQGGGVSLASGDLKKVSQLPRAACQVVAVDLADLPNLKGDLLAEKIRAAQTLQELNLSNTSLNNANMTGIATSKSLKRLILTGVPISDAGLTNLSAMSQLELLDLRGTRVTGSAFADIAAFKSLSHLYVGSTQVSDRQLAALVRCPSLVALDFTANKQVTDKGLAELKPLTKLQQLGLRSTGVTNAGLATISQFKELRLLDLEGTAVTDDGISQLKDLKELRSINLNKTQVSDSTLTTLANFSELRYVNVSRTKVTDAAVETLRQSLPQCRVVKSASTGPKDPEGTSGTSGGPFGGLGL